MVLLLPSRRLSVSTQLRLSGIGLLAWALAGLISIVLETAGPHHAALAVSGSLLVAALCVCSVLLALALSRTYWHRLQDLLAAARPGTTQRLLAETGWWDLARMGVFVAIGVGMVTAFAQGSSVDLTVATLALAHAGAVSLGTAFRIRKVECCNHVLYYCLADSLHSWRLVSLREAAPGGRGY